MDESIEIRRREMTDRISAHDGESLAGKTIVRGLYRRNQDHDIQNRGNKQPLSGNRCGHDPKKIRIPLFPAHHKRRPHALEEAKRRIIFAQNSPYDFPHMGEVFHHPNKNGRKRRSEGVEAINNLVLSTLLHTVNLATMASGDYEKGNHFKHYDYYKLSQLAGMSYPRFKRAMAELQRLGFVHVVPCFKKNHNGDFRINYVQIILTEKIFRALGLMNELQKDRERALTKWKRKTSKIVKKETFHRRIVSDIAQHVLNVTTPVSTLPNRQQS